MFNLINVTLADEELDLSTSILDPGGPFMLLNALNPLEPGETLTLLICFTPNQGRVFQETLKVRTRWFILIPCTKEVMSPVQLYLYLKILSILIFPSQL